MWRVENYFQEENLLSNIKIAAYFILLYEHFEDMVIDTVHEFYASPCALDGKLFYDIDDAYIRLLGEKIAQGTECQILFKRILANAKHAREVYRREILGEENKKDARKFRGSLKWLQKHDVITGAEIDRILAIKDRRNRITHELLHEIGKGFSDDDAKMIADMLNIQQQINAWRFQQIEMPIMEIEMPDGTDPDDVMSSDDVLLMSIFRILFCGEGDQFKQALDKELKKTPL